MIIWRHAILRRVPTVLPVSELKIATLNGEAMFFHQSIDFSHYAGGLYFFEFIDSTGKIATAWGGNAGGGEAESVQFSDDMSADETAGWTTKKRCTLVFDTDKYVMTRNADGSAQDIRHSYTEAVGHIRKDTVRIKDGSASNVAFTVDMSSALQPNKNTSGSYVDNTFYRASTFAGSLQIILITFLTSNGDSVDLQGYKVSWLTDIPITGLHLVSAKDGATRNMTSVEADFNPSTITTVRVWGPE